jgi:hypothetical protein
MSSVIEQIAHRADSGRRVVTEAQADISGGKSQSPRKSLLGINHVIFRPDCAVLI